MTDRSSDTRATITLEHDPVTAGGVQRTVLGGLLAYNRAQAGEAHQEVVTLSARAPDGTVVGGLVAATVWQWLLIHMLWVDEPYRGTGVGRALLRAAEAEARGRGCHAACVDTIDFQAPEFYAREGYVAFGVLDGFPPGHQRTYYRKALDRSSSSG